MSGPAKRDALPGTDAVPDADVASDAGPGLLRGDWLDAVRWDGAGLVPAIAQEEGSGRILMVAWMNREALHETAHALVSDLLHERQRVVLALLIPN